MTYRAPVADIAFALKHAAGLRPGAGRGPLRRPHRGRGRCRAGGSRPVRDRRDRAAQRGRRPPRHAVQGRRRHHRRRAGRRPIAPGRQAGWNGLAAPGAMGRPGAAARGQCRLHRNVELGRHGLRPRPGADHGRRRCARGARQRRAQARLSAEARLRRMDGHDAAHRAAGRLRCRRAAHQGRARRRRQLSHHRAEDLHHLRRARSHRQHHPFRAGAAARRAAGNARHLAVPGAEIPAQRRRLARRAQRRARAFDRAQARHPRLAHLHHGARRRGRRHRLPHRRGEPRHGLHVHHDEPGAALRSALQGVAIAERATQQALAYARERKQGRAAGATRRREPDHRASRRQAHAAHHARAHPRRARHLLRHRGRARPRRSAAPTRPRAGPRTSAPRCSRRSPRRSRPISASRSPRSACRCTAAWATSRRPAPRSTSAMRASPRSTKAPTASRRSTSSPASCRSRAARRCKPASASCGAPSRRSRPPTIRPSAGPACGSRRRSTASSARRIGCSAASTTIPTPRWRARRPICGCSRSRPAARCWPRRRSRRARLAGNGADAGRAHRDRALLCRECRGAGRRRSSAP